MIISLQEYLDNKEKYKGIPITITLDGLPPKEIVEEDFEIPTPQPQPQPQTPTVEERLQALEQLELERMFEL